MYLLLKEKLKPVRDNPEEWQLPSDKYMVSEPDLYYREESFNFLLMIKGAATEIKRTGNGQTCIKKRQRI